MEIKRLKISVIYTVLLNISFMTLKNTGIFLTFINQLLLLQSVINVAPLSLTKLQMLHKGIWVLCCEGIAKYYTAVKCFFENTRANRAK